MLLRALRQYQNALHHCETDGDRSSILKSAAQCAVSVGALGKAREYAERLLALAERLSAQSRGGALHVAHLTVGHAALDADQPEKASQHLLEAADALLTQDVLRPMSPGFGLARALAARGGIGAVTDFLRRLATAWPDNAALYASWARLLERNPWAPPPLELWLFDDDL